MITEYWIIPTDDFAPFEIHEVEWPEKPGYNTIGALIKPIINADFEHVTVWLTPDFKPGKDGRYTDMFVDEIGLLKSLPRNERATAIYRANWLTYLRPDDDPESLFYIAGPAVLFMRKVWF